MAENWTAEQIGIYNDFAADGFTVTVRVEGSAGTWNPETLSYDNAADDTDYATYGIKTRYYTQHIDGTIIQMNDIKLLIPAYGLPALTINHKVLIGSIEQNVISVSSIEPGNVPLLYELQVRP